VANGLRSLADISAALAGREPGYRNVDGGKLTVCGLRFRFAAILAQRVAMVLAGRRDTVEDYRIEGTNASGAAFSGEHQVVRRCVLRGNGFASSPHDKAGQHPGH
jgi:hypothetical protein